MAVLPYDDMRFAISTAAAMLSLTELGGMVVGTGGDNKPGIKTDIGIMVPNIEIVYHTNTDKL